MFVGSAWHSSKLTLKPTILSFNPPADRFKGGKETNKTFRLDKGLTPINLSSERFANVLQTCGCNRLLRAAPAQPGDQAHFHSLAWSEAKRAPESNRALPTSFKLAEICWGGPGQESSPVGWNTCIQHSCEPVLTGHFEGNVEKRTVVVRITCDAGPESHFLASEHLSRKC